MIGHSVRFHGGPLDGQDRWYSMDDLRQLRRVRVPVWLDNGAPFLGPFADMMAPVLDQAPQIGQFVYAVSMEQYPPNPVTGTTWIAYPEVTSHRPRKRRFA